MGQTTDLRGIRFCDLLGSAFPLFKEKTVSIFCIPFLQWFWTLRFCQSLEPLLWAVPSLPRFCQDTGLLTL